MAINTQTLTTNGTTTPHTWTGGDGTAIATGEFSKGRLALEFSLDGTNYAPVGPEGTLYGPSGFNFKLPACDLRWNLSGATTPNIVASTEEV